MTPFDKVTPGIWEAKRATNDGEYNMMAKRGRIYG
jgi:hypothetical protein